ncbi:hypothetical protein ACTFIW_000820 [Dictyostelium discoideum]
MFDETETVHVRKLAKLIRKKSNNFETAQCTKKNNNAIIAQVALKYVYHYVNNDEAYSITSASYSAESFDLRMKSMEDQINNLSLAFTRFNEQSDDGTIDNKLEHRHCYFTLPYGKQSIFNLIYIPIHITTKLPAPLHNHQGQVLNVPRSIDQTISRVNTNQNSTTL